MHLAYNKNSTPTSGNNMNMFYTPSVHQSTSENTQVSLYQINVFFIVNKSDFYSAKAEVEVFWVCILKYCLI